MLKIAVLSQKGGVGKSTISKLLVVGYARAGWKVLLADMDVSQTSSLEWNTRRKGYGAAPDVDVRAFHTPQAALGDASFDLIVFDGAPHASLMSKEIAQIADLIILPTGSSIDDLNPQIRLAHELVENSVSKEKLLFVLSKIGNSAAELQEALLYLQQTGYRVSPHPLPEKTAYRKLAREGKALNEAPYPGLKIKAIKFTQFIIDSIK